MIKGDIMREAICISVSHTPNSWQTRPPCLPPRHYAHGILVILLRMERATRYETMKQIKYFSSCFLRLLADGHIYADFCVCNDLFYFVSVSIARCGSLVYSQFPL